MGRDAALLALAEAALEAARDAGAIDAEAAAESSRAVAADIEAGALARVEDVTSLGVSLRVRTHSGVGLAAGGPHDVAALAARAVALARPAPPSFRFVAAGASSWRSAPDPPPIHRVTRAALELRAAGAGRGCMVTGGGVGAGRDAFALVTTGGFRGLHASAWTACSASVLADAPRPGTASETAWSPSHRLDAAAVGAAARSKARAARGATAYRGSARRVVLAPAVAEELLGAVLLPAIRGERVARKESPLAGRLGRRVAAPALTVAEAPPGRELPRPEPWDDEGAPVTARPYVADGVLEGLATSRLEAARYAIPAEGPAVRDGAGAAVIGSARNLVVEADPRRPADLWDDARGGLLVEDVLGAHTANPATGAWSVEVAGALAIDRRGEPGPARCGVVLSGTLDTLLRGTIATGTDARWTGGAPDIRVGSVLVEGVTLHRR